LADEEFPVTEIFSSYWVASEKKLHRNQSAARTYLPNGHAPAAGDIFRNPDLAWSLQQIAKRGRKGFYEGALARRVLKGSTGLGGTLSAADLAKFSAEWVDRSRPRIAAGPFMVPPNGGGSRRCYAQPNGEFPAGKFDPIPRMRCT
jgi:gamma-glutamyltranspeptidase/glutathione hydrolase